MHDYNYRILLDRDARIAPRYSAGEGEALWLHLQDGRLVAQRAFKETGALEQALAAERP